MNDAAEPKDFNRNRYSLLVFQTAHQTEIYLYLLCHRDRDEVSLDDTVGNHRVREKAYERVETEDEAVTVSAQTFRHFGPVNI